MIQKISSIGNNISFSRKIKPKTIRQNHDTPPLVQPSSEQIRANFYPASKPIPFDDVKLSELSFRLDKVIDRKNSFAKGYNLAMEENKYKVLFADKGSEDVIRTDLLAKVIKNENQLEHIKDSVPSPSLYFRALKLKGQNSALSSLSKETANKSMDDPYPDIDAEDTVQKIAGLFYIAKYQTLNFDQKSLKGELIQKEYDLEKKTSDFLHNETRNTCLMACKAEGEYHAIKDKLSYFELMGFGDSAKEKITARLGSDAIFKDDGKTYDKYRLEHKKRLIYS